MLYSMAIDWFAVLTSMFSWLQIIFAVLLTAAILMQRSDESLGSAFGGNAGGGFLYTKRGFERTLFIGTIVLGILFIAYSIAALLVS